MREKETIRGFWLLEEEARIVLKILPVMTLENQQKVISKTVDLDNIIVNEANAGSKYSDYIICSDANSLWKSYQENRRLSLKGNT